MNTSDANAAIPPPTMKDELTIYEAAMFYAGRDPYPAFFGLKHRRNSKPEHLLKYLKLGLSEKRRKHPRAQRSWDIFRDLIQRIELGEIKATRPAYDLTGKIDPFLSVIQIADLVELAKNRGERPKSLRNLLVAADEQASKRRLTKPTANKFAADYINKEKRAGRRPTMARLERAAANAKFHGGREFLRDAFRRIQGAEVKPGRPRTKFAKK